MKMKLIHRRLLAGFIVTVLGGLALLVWSTTDIDAGVYVDCLCKGPEHRHCVTLTFDDGPDEVMTPKVLDVLKRYDVKATFFIIGEKAEKHPELIARIFDEGHVIGCHSWYHDFGFPLQSSSGICDELSRCEDFVYGLTGQRVTLFRPPFGVTNPLIADAVKEMDYKCIGWSIRSLDTDQSKERKDILERVTSQLHDGAVILLHDRCEDADVLLEMLVSDLLQKNYDIINIDEMFGLQPYRSDI